MKQICDCPRLSTLILFQIRLGRPLKLSPFPVRVIKQNFRVHISCWVGICTISKKFRPLRPQPFWIWIIVARSRRLSQRREIVMYRNWPSENLPVSTPYFVALAQTVNGRKVQNLTHPVYSRDVGCSKYNGFEAGK